MKNFSEQIKKVEIDLKEFNTPVFVIQLNSNGYMIQIYWTLNQIMIRVTVIEKCPLVRAHDVIFFLFFDYFVVF